MLPTGENIGGKFSVNSDQNLLGLMYALALDLAERIQGAFGQSSTDNGIEIVQPYIQNGAVWAKQQLICLR